MTFTLDLPEELARQLTALPDAERSRFATAALADALDARVREGEARLIESLLAELDPEQEPEREAAECIAIVEQELADMEAGRGKSITLEEARRQWEAEKAARRGLVQK